MPGKKVKFSRTEAAAKNDRLTKWDLIAAIAEDADEAGVPITGAESVVAAAAAFESAGSEYSDHTVRHLCLVAKYDHESTAAQRRIWRRYGWSIIRRLSAAGWSTDASAEFLGAEHRSFADVMRAVGHNRSVNVNTAKAFDERCAQWVQRANKLMMDGAELFAESETLTNVGSQAEMALMIYQRLAERHMDTEIRRFFETEAVG